MFVEKMPIVKNNILKSDIAYKNEDKKICALYDLNEDEISYIVNE